MIDKKLKYNFFKVLLLCVIVEELRFFIHKLLTKESQEMYQRAKRDAHLGNQPLIEFYKS
jgi:hypothetical protein